VKKTLPILFEDDDYIFLNKPPGLLVIPDRFDQDAPNLLEMLKKIFGQIFVVHRIDKPTSGVIVFAKNTDAHRELNIQFEQHLVRKTYWALVCGKLSEKEGTIDKPIAENASRAGTVKIDASGKPSQTGYHVLEELGQYSLVEVVPRSGRTHQIRIHFKSVGHPLAIDELYGNAHGIFLSQFKKNYRLKEDETERPLMNRLTLHAFELQFTHFRNHEPIVIQALLPKDFSGLLNQLRKYR